MKRVILRSTLTLSAGCLSLAFLAGCLGISGPATNSNGALSTQTKGGAIDTGKTACVHEHANASGKENQANDSAKVGDEKDNDSAEVAGCDDKEHHSGKGVEGADAGKGGEGEKSDSTKTENEMDAKDAKSGDAMEAGKGLEASGHMDGGNVAGADTAEVK